MISAVRKMSMTNKDENVAEAKRKMGMKRKMGVKRKMGMKMEWG